MRFTKLLWQYLIDIHSSFQSYNKSFQNAEMLVSNTNQNLIQEEIKRRLNLSLVQPSLFPLSSEHNTKEILLSWAPYSKTMAWCDFNKFTQ
jgi:hypothetical protein